MPAEARRSSSYLEIGNKANSDSSGARKALLGPMCAVFHCHCRPPRSTSALLPLPALSQSQRASLFSCQYYTLACYHFAVVASMALCTRS